MRGDAGEGVPGQQVHWNTGERRVCLRVKVQCARSHLQENKNAQNLQTSSEGFFFWRLGINSIVNFCYYITIKTLFQISSFSFQLLTSTLVITIFIDILIYYLISWLVKTALKAYLSSRSIFENFLINIINSSYTIQITVM